MGLLSRHFEDDGFFKQVELSNSSVNKRGMEGEKAKGEEEGEKGKGKRYGIWGKETEGEGEGGRRGKGKR